MVPWLVQMFVLRSFFCQLPLTSQYRPYYVFLGCSRSRSTERAFKAFEIEAGNTAGSGHIAPLHSPALPAGMTSPTSSVSSSSTVMDMPELELGPSALADKAADTNAAGRTHLTLPLSSFHYQSRYEAVFFCVIHI